MENEIYVSTDIEADGPIPGLYSMLSIGSAAYKVDGRLLGTFSANLATLPGATEHPEHRKFWSDHPDAWEVARKDPRDPSIVMPEYVEWIKALPGIPVFVGFPAAYDFSFVAWYLHKFTGECPFFHSALDMKTLAMSLLGLPFRESVKRNMPKRWFGVAQHTCCALDDAIEQGAAFCRMMGEVWERTGKA
jgi:hypothetical protein